MTSLHTRRTLILCFFAAALEGADIVSMGLAAPMVAQEMAFSAELLSYVLTAAIVGLMIGAAIGGRLGDRWGRKRVLVISFTLLGIFSLATMLAYDVGSRSEEHTSELQSLMRISYAVFCLKKKQRHNM